jgi:hypothetical protein
MKTSNSSPIYKPCQYSYYTIKHDNKKYALADDVVSKNLLTGTVYGAVILDLYKG